MIDMIYYNCLLWKYILLENWGCSWCFLGLTTNVLYVLKKYGQTKANNPTEKPYKWLLKKALFFLHICVNLERVE